MVNEHKDSTQAPHSPSPDGEALHALAVRLLDYAGTENLKLLVGVASNQLPADIPLPDGSRLLGSLERNDAITVVFDSALDAAAVVALYRTSLTDGGWYEPVRRTYNSGFTFGTTTGTRDWLQLCRSRRGPSLELSVWQGDGQPTQVQLTFRRDGRHAACAHEERASPYGEWLPQLSPPPNSRQVPGGGSASSDFQSSDATLTTALDLAAITDHYTAQLAAAGCQPEGRGVGSALAWHTWTFVDQEGEPWQGLFMARTRPNLPGEVLLHLRIDRLGGQLAGS
jgi:hypothetical protein